jgi:hypothetical protein
MPRYLKTTGESFSKAAKFGSFAGKTLLKGIRAHESSV